MDVIADTSDITDPSDEELREDMTATTESDQSAKIEFHVQMRSWTQDDMMDLVIEAAARQIVGRHGRESQIAKAVEASAVAQITAKADEKLKEVSAAIIDQPILPTFGAKEPVTLREFIGLYAKDYLTQTVDREGKPCTGVWGDKVQPRINYIVEQTLDRKFRAEIEKATNTAIAEIQNEIRAAHKRVLEAETIRIRAAIDKAVTA